ncbi:MAG: late competence development ComFB family protein [Lachnospiraceae bacterium]|nr:late competence development ComFB family protein [Lachnospiraceae bacterium]
MEGLKNMMEDNVESMLNHLLPTMPNICSCDDCKLDMATYALNRLHPKYARTAKGAILHRFDSLTAQVEAEILTACVSAINIIGSHPHHEAKDGNKGKEADTNNETNTAAEAATAGDANNTAS